MRRCGFPFPRLLLLVLIGLFLLPPPVVRPLRVKAIALGSFLQNGPATKTSSSEGGGTLQVRVVYREPATWNSVLWIDRGSDDHVSELAEKSPVLSEGDLVGVVDLVERKRSRVRLITDSSLVVSVRAVRGEPQRRKMVALLDRLMRELHTSGEECVEEKGVLSTLRERLAGKTKGYYLAKGEVFGTSSPLWRSRALSLKGVGFNYDFADDKGPARELRTGKPYDALFDDPGLCLLRPGDLLVTTGMDGVFPADIPVASVSHIDPLEEGAPSYSIRADPASPSLPELMTVTILSPLK
ncbi:MAG: rod shape-determining protein MreC [Simkaniaceae bacterium]|nr:rod shape-determining protein MreC [Simkaniaceae bacterium]